LTGLAMHTARRDTLGMSDEVQPTWTRNCEDHERSIGGGNGLKHCWILWQILQDYCLYRQLQSPVTADQQKI